MDLKTFIICWFACGVTCSLIFLGKLLESIADNERLNPFYTLNRLPLMWLAGFFAVIFLIGYFVHLNRVAKAKAWWQSIGLTAQAAMFNLSLREIILQGGLNPSEKTLLELYDKYSKTAAPPLPDKLK